MYLLKFSLLIAPAVMGLWFGLSRLWGCDLGPPCGLLERPDEDPPRPPASPG